MKTDTLAAAGLIRGMKLPTHTIKPKPDMFYLTNRQIRTIHLSALAIAITNGVLAGMFLGRLITPDGGTAMDALFALASLFWAVVALTINLQTRRHPHGYVSYRANVTTDALGDLRPVTGDGTAFRQE